MHPQAEQNSDYDPDLYVVTSLVVASLAMFGTWVSVVDSLHKRKSERRRELSRENANATYRRIRDSGDKSRRALSRIENLFCVYEQRVAADGFSALPRVGTFRAQFSGDEFDEFQSAFADLESGLREVRQWSLHAVKTSSSSEMPLEYYIAEHLESLDERLNYAAFEVKSFAEQIAVLRQTLDTVIDTMSEAIEMRN